MNRVIAEAIGERGDNVPSPTDRDRVEAARIASRVLYQFQEQGKLAVPVKGGRLGIFNTAHDAPIYDLVAQHLLGVMDEVEISVVRISSVTGVPYVRDPVRAIHADVISAKRMGGFAKYPDPNPSENPTAFIGTRFGGMPAVPPFQFELMYPNQSQPQPATA